MSAAIAVPPMNAGMMPPPAAPQQQEGQEPTADDPKQGTPEENQQAIQLSEEEKAALLKIRREYKMSWSQPRRAKVQSVLKKWELLKGNPYISFDPEGFQWYDPIETALNGTGNDDLDLYRYTNNVYQMLALSFVAALSPDVPKTRYQPDNPDDETDIATARRASSIMAIIERRNKIKALQKLELLHLWTGGCYFSYTRFVIDSDRFKSTKQPIIEPVETEVTPDQYICPQCGEKTPADGMAIFQKPICDCGYELGEEDFYEAQHLPIPTEVGVEEVPNGMTLMTVFGALNIDAAPYAEDCFETPILDLEVETTNAAVRAAYPGAWDRIRPTSAGAGDPNGDTERLARMQLSTTPGGRSGYLSTSLVTYSRCWIQDWAFNHLDDKSMAEALKQKFPKGCKLVTVGQEEFLEAVPAKLTEEWTWCGTVKGLGLFPFAVGDAAADVQARIDDVANKTHEHMDRNASPTVLVDEDAIDGEAMNGKAMYPGTFTLVKRKGALAGKPLSDIMWQPKFEIDGNIYSYGSELVQLAQLLSGVLPQVFGGSDQNVKTFGGQRQQLNTAMGKLALYWDQIREEHATRSENAVKCFASNMPDEVRNVVEGDTESGYENEFVLLTEMQGQFHAYPESDQGFPATWAEIRDRLMEMMANTENPLVQAFLSDPENLEIVSRYLAPPDAKVPGKAARTKIKRTLGELAKSEPMEVQPEEAVALGLQVTAPTFLPQTADGLCLPDRDFDAKYLGMIVDLCMEWGQKNWKMAYTNPAGFENVRAYLRQAQTLQSQQMAAAAVTQAQAQAKNGTPGEDPQKETPTPPGA